MGEGGDGTDQRTAAIGWFGVVVFGRLYTVILCDVPGRMFGFDWPCYTWIHDIPIYLWVELTLYGPVMWFALHQITADVFGDVPTEPARATHRRIQFAATAAAAVFFYGVGVHVADTVEVLSRQREGITDGPVYELVYFLDEGLSHYIQFVSLMFVIGWFVIFDRRGRHDHRDFALFVGVAHGVERGLGTIEGEKWYLGPVLVLWMATAAWLRHRRVGSAAFDEFFFRYAVAFTLTLPVCQTVYYLWFGGFEAPSAFGDDDYGRLAVGAIALTIAGTGLATAADRLWRGALRKDAITSRDQR